jgi:hypothetical protein
MWENRDRDHAFKLMWKDAVTLITIKVSTRWFTVAIEIHPGAYRIVIFRRKLRGGDANFERRRRARVAWFVSHTLHRCLGNYLSRSVRSPNSLQRNVRRRAPESWSCSRYEYFSHYIYVSFRFLFPLPRWIASN